MQVLKTTKGLAMFKSTRFIIFFLIGSQWLFPAAHAAGALDYSDNTLRQPNKLFMETPESKSVAVGSQVQASILGCSNMQQYRIRTNTDFTSTMNLFKYRASLMGSKRVVIVYHAEVDASESIGEMNVSDVLIREGTTLLGSRIHTTLVGDLYDCPLRS